LDISILLRKVSCEMETPAEKAAGAVVYGQSVSDGNLIVKVIFAFKSSAGPDKKRDPSASGCGIPQPDGRDDVRSAVEGCAGRDNCRTGCAGRTVAGVDDVEGDTQKEGSLSLGLRKTAAQRSG